MRSQIRTRDDVGGLSLRALPDGGADLCAGFSLAGFQALLHYARVGYLNVLVKFNAVCMNKTQPVRVS